MRRAKPTAMNKNDRIMIEAFRWDKYGISGRASWDIGDFHLWISYDHTRGWVVDARNWRNGVAIEYRPRSKKELYETFDKIRGNEK